MLIATIADNWPTVAFVGALLIALLLARLLLKGGRYPYAKRASLLTEPELKFYGALRDAVDGRWTILAMVRMADIIRVKKGTASYQSWQNRIQSKHIDFVLCDHDSLEALVAIELDDSSHQRADRRHRDDFVNAAFDDARLPLLRVPLAANYDVRHLKKTIKAALT